MLSGIPAEGMERLIEDRTLTFENGGIEMKVIFNPRRFGAPERSGNISAKGAFRGANIDFLAVMARLYQMPFLWFSEAIFIELDFDSEKLVLKVPADQTGTFMTREVIEEISFGELICLPAAEIRDKYIRPFAANLAENAFGMPETAKAIRERRLNSLISEIAAREGHPVLDTEIENLLFREKWEIETSFGKLAN